MFASIKAYSLIALLLIASQSHAGVSFNGTSDCGQTASSVTLGSVSTVTQYLDISSTSTTGTTIWLEQSSNYNNSSTGDFVVDPTNSPSISHGWEFNTHVTGSYQQFTCDNLASNGFSGTHNVAFFQHINVAGSIWIDGSSRTTGAGGLGCTTSSGSGTFTSDSVFLFARACSSIFTAATLDVWAIWNVDTGDAVRHALSAGVPPLLAWGGPSLKGYWICGTAGCKDFSESKNNITLTGTTISTASPAIHTPLFPQGLSAY